MKAILLTLISSLVVHFIHSAQCVKELCVEYEDEDCYAQVYCEPTVKLDESIEKSTLVEPAKMNSYKTEEEESENSVKKDSSAESNETSDEEPIMSFENFKPSRLSAFLANSLVGFVNSDIAEMMNEKLKKPARESKHIHLRVIIGYGEPTYNWNGLYESLNSILLSDTESEDEAAKALLESDHYVDKLIIYSYSEYDRSSHGQDLFCLNEKLFEAALYKLNVDRFNELLTKKKHLLLKKEAKINVLKEAFRKSKYSDKVEVFSEIFKKLLDNGFYPEDHDLDEISIWGMPNLLPFEDALRDLRAYKPFLQYDKDIFSKQKLNYISHFIEKGKSGSAIKALRYGFNPEIVDERTKLNALDEALRRGLCGLEPQEIESLKELTRILLEEYKMEPANTGVNLEYMCNARQWEEAIALIKRGDMKYVRLSPIGIALSSNNIDVINAAIDTYLDKLPEFQLRIDLKFLRPKKLADETQNKLIEEAREKIQERVKKLQESA